MQLHSCLTSARGADEWSTRRLAAVPQRRNCSVGPTGSLDVSERKSRSCRGSNTDHPSPSVVTITRHCMIPCELQTTWTAHCRMRYMSQASRPQNVASSRSARHVGRLHDTEGLYELPLYGGL